MSRTRTTPSKRPSATFQRQAIIDRRVRLGLIVMAVIIVLILGYGIYRIGIVQPREPVAVVNGSKITLSEYQTMVRYNRLNLASQIESLQANLASIDPTDENNAFLRQIIEQQLQSLQEAATSLPVQTMEDMIDQELIRQEATARGLTASAEELEKADQEFFGYDPNPPTPEPSPTVEPSLTLVATDETEVIETTEATTGPEITPGPTSTPLPTPTPYTQEAYEELRAGYLTFLKREAGVTESAFNRWLETRVLEEKLQQALEAEVPGNAPQVLMQEVTVPTQEEASQALARLQAGEDFATVYEALMATPEVTETVEPAATADATDAPTPAATPAIEETVTMPEAIWISEWSTAVAADIVSQALEMNPGESKIISSWDGFHVVQVLEKADDRPLSEEELANRRSQALSSWLQEARSGEGVKRYWSSDKVPAQ